MTDIVAGDTLSQAVSVAGYPASAGWTLKYRLTPRFSTPSQSPIVLTGAASGDLYLVQEVAANSANWKAGAYTWAAWVEKAGERYTVSPNWPSGSEIAILADPAQTAQGFDGRSHARKVLEAIEAVLERRATLDQEEYAINGRSLKRTPLPELLRLRQQYAAEVASEDAGALLSAGLGGGRKVQVRL